MPRSTRSSQEGSRKSTILGSCFGISLLISSRTSSTASASTNLHNVPGAVGIYSGGTLQCQLQKGSLTDPLFSAYVPWPKALVPSCYPQDAGLWRVRIQVDTWGQL